MTTARKISFLLFLLLTAAFTPLLSAQNTARVRDNVIAALKASDGQTIANCLNDLCDLDLPGNRGTFSKAQAGRFIRDFMASHTLEGLKIIRQGTLAEKEEYTMGEVRSGQKTLKIYFVVKEKDGKGVVPLFHITE